MGGWWFSAGSLGGPGLGIQPVQGQGSRGEGCLAGPELSLFGEEWVVEEGGGRKEEGRGVRVSRGGGATERLGHEGRAGFWILIQRAVGAIAELQSDGGEISAEQTRGSGGRGECGLVSCGWWEWHAVLLPERVVGSGHGTPETSGFAHSCSLPRWWRVSRGWSLGSEAGRRRDPESEGAIVQRHVRVLPELGEIPTYGLAGSREDQEELMVGPRTAHPQHIPGPALLLGGCRGWRPTSPQE